MIILDEKVNDELAKCYGCKNKPCQNKCPLGNDVTSIIGLIKEEKYEEAFELLSQTTVLPSICSRVCPHMKQCQSSCTAAFKGEAVNVGIIESFLGDMALENDWKFSKISDELKDKKIAIIGGGPAGLTVAAFLARNGASVTIFEKHENLGGILMYGIPDFRLDNDILYKAISKILELGIEVKVNSELGKDVFIDDLKGSFDAIFLGFGANVSNKMRIPGEDLNGVFGGNELLEYGNHPLYDGKNVYVCGGGNVAMDSARTIKKMGANNVTVVYRRSEEEMPAEKKEIAEAKAEGIKFLFHTNLIEILGDNSVNNVRCIKTAYEGEKLKNVPGTEFDLDANYVVMSIGASANSNLLKSLGLELNDKGYIKVNDNYRTSDEKVFAAGDLIGEKSTVAWASRSGRNAAESIKKYLQEG
ncbi:MAG: FAD-dependent oxidoreductase [Clostridia bacterium]|nr:FAD-dependent oxidoreductase [Clostridia bacterium]